MKDRLSQPIRTIGLLLLAALLSNSCQREDPSADFGQQDNGKGTLPFVSKRKTFGELNQDPRFANAYGKIAPRAGAAPNGSAKTVMEDRYGFTIDSSLVKEVTYGNYVSYTFFIRRDVPEDGVFENLIVDADSLGNVRAFIARHTLNAPIGYVEEHGAYTLDSEVELMPIEYSDEQSKLIYSCTQNYELRCNGRGNGTCNASPHLVGPECYEFSPLCIYLTSTTSCGFEDVPDEGGGGGGSSPPNPGPGNDPPPHPGGNGSGNNNGNGNDDLPVINDPVVEEEAQKKECNKIKNKLTSIPDFMANLQVLETKTSENEEYGVYKLASSNTMYMELPQASGQISFPTPLQGAKYEILAHTHNSPANSTLSIFSWYDIEVFAGFLKNGKIDGTEFVTYLMTADGTRYAMTINDTNSFLEFMAIAGDDNFNMTVAQRRVDAMNKYYNLFNDSNVDPLIDNDHLPQDNLAPFLQMLQDYNMGLSLFEVVDGTYENYKELVYNSNTQQIDETPCP